MFLKGLDQDRLVGPDAPEAVAWAILVAPAMDSIASRAVPGASVPRRHAKKLEKQFVRHMRAAYYVGTFVCACLAACRSDAGPAIQKFGAAMLWRTASSRCMVDYPASAKASRHQGLAVLEVDVAPDGTVRRSSVLEAPDDAISQALRSCAATFRAAPSSTGAAVRRGKLIFYFVLWGDQSGVFIANDPAQRTELMQIRESLGPGWLK